MRLEQLPQDLEVTLSSPHPRPTITWLGQAGFLVREADGGRSVLIDPYLSDSLAGKYAGRLFPHTRLVPVPVQPNRLDDVDVVLCTHRHTDHMDAATLVPLATSSECVFIVPAAWVEHMAAFGIARDRIIGATEGLAIEADGVTVTPVLAAHEQIERDDLGRSLHLGYVITLDGVTFYHSGDCCPYPGQIDTLAELAVDVALLPVNGRDEYRASNGVPGNFHPSEAFALATGIAAEVLVAHHFGLFDFNTVDRAELEREALDVDGSLAILVPTVAATYEVIDDI